MLTALVAFLKNHASAANTLVIAVTTALGILFLWILRGRGLAGLKAWINALAERELPIVNAMAAATTLCITAADNGATTEVKNSHFANWRSVVHDSVWVERRRRRRNGNVTLAVLLLVGALILGGITITTYLMACPSNTPNNAPPPWTIDDARKLAVVMFPWILATGFFAWFAVPFGFLAMKHGPPSPPSA